MRPILAKDQMRPIPWVNQNLSRRCQFSGLRKARRIESSFS
jgi:hypothetical protein